ncbi:MAG: hypothetical protein IPK81_23325 [Rhodospirillales bacterium]|nr:MAG: hypothetical protein IPK81_23325 [Rhodospirillales bacterium]
MADGTGRSIRKRLLRNFALLFGATVVALSGFFVWSSWDHREALADDQLEELADLVVGGATRAADGTVDLRLGAAKRARLEATTGVRVFVHDPGTRRTVHESPPGFAATLPLSPAIEWRWAYLLIDPVDTPVDQRVQLLMATKATAAGPLRVAIARDEPSDDFPFRWIATAILTQVLPVVGPIAVLAIALGLWTLGRELEPVAKAAEQANVIGVDSTGARISTEVPAEVRPLVDAINRALDRLDIGFSEQRRFTAEAAHELRTPLSVLRARLDGMDESVAADIRGDVDRMARVVDQLLAVSRLDSRLPMERVEVDLGSVASDVVARLAPLAVARGRQLSLTAHDRPVRVRGDPDMLGAAIRNLVENAMRFAPVDSTVEVVVAEDARVEVHDAGPGIAAADRPHVFERFWRRREGGSQGGAGLGLAIVAEIAKRHGGSIGIERSPLGGALVRVELPRLA